MHSEDFLFFFPVSRKETNWIKLLFFSGIVKQISNGVAEFIHPRALNDYIYRPYINADAADRIVTQLYSFRHTISTILC
jgi:hypothetical protein